MELTKSEKLIFALLRKAINEIPVEVSLLESCTESDWNECYRIAVKQGVMAIAWDAIVAIPYELQPPKRLKINWGLAVENYSRTYHRYCAVADQLAKFYDSNGIKTLLLKGVGLSSYYPVPERRQGGDIDIYTFSADESKMTHKEANELADQLMRDKGVKFAEDTYKHSSFCFNGIPIENHKCFLNVNRYKVAKLANDYLSDIFHTEGVSLFNGTKILIPTIEFNKVLVVTHALQHLGTGLSLHHLCDWAVILRHTDFSLPEQLSDDKFRKGVLAMTQLCIKYLGTEYSEGADINPLCNVILNDIFYNKYHKKELPQNHIKRLWFKTQRLIYVERLRAQFWDLKWVNNVMNSVMSNLKHPSKLFLR